MTVKELISQLQQIEDPEIDVFYIPNGGGLIEIIDGVDLKTANENKFCMLLPSKKSSCCTKDSKCSSN